MTCSRCTADVAVGSLFCPRCGAPVALAGWQSATHTGVPHEEKPLSAGSPIDGAPAGASNAAPSGGPRYAGTVTRTATSSPMQTPMPRDGASAYGAMRGGSPERGRVTPGRLAQFATWWSRVGSRLIDGLVLVVPRLILVYVVLFNFDSFLRGGRGLFFTQGGDFFHSVEIAFPIVGALGILYFVLFNGLGTGQTLGNRAAGIAVRDATTGKSIGIARSFTRSLVRTLLYATLLIPALVKVPIPTLILWIPGLTNDLFPLWDARRQTLADKVARSVMIKVA